MPLDVNTRLGPYSIDACVGSGGMGDVYRAWDSRLERYVAIKLLNEELASDEHARSRFRKEARAVAALAHPNILSVYDAELEHPPFFLVTELLQGETLRCALKDAPFPLERVLAVGSAIAEGLATAHEAGVLHRDIKPENIFLTAAGAVKILDFGLAHFQVARQPEGAAPPWRKCKKPPATAIRAHPSFTTGAATTRRSQLRTARIFEIPRIAARRMRPQPVSLRCCQQHQAKGAASGETKKAQAYTISTADPRCHCLLYSTGIAATMNGQYPPRPRSAGPSRRS